MFPLKQKMNPSEESVKEEWRRRLVERKLQERFLRTREEEGNNIIAMMWRGYICDCSR